MDFIKYDVGFAQAGSIVEVHLQGNAANVRLLDSANFQSYRAGQPHRGYGGLATRSPVKLQVPHAGTWFVVLDRQGLAPAHVRASVQLIPPLRPLPVINEAPLRSMPSLVRREPPEAPPTAETADERTFDVFISHASEDKDEVVRPLATALRSAGLGVWYDEFELKIGDSLRRKIDKGLASSRFGVVVISKAFFGRGWPEYELDGLVTRAVSGDQILLPIWHNVTKREVISYSPSLADRLARNTATHTVEEIAAEIVEVIRNPAE